MATTIDFHNEHIDQVECGDISTAWAYANVSVYIEIDCRHTYAAEGRWRFERQKDGQWVSKVPEDHLKVRNPDWDAAEPGDDHYNRARALLALYTPSVIAQLPQIRTTAIERRSRNWRRS